MSQPYAHVIRCQGSELASIRTCDAPERRDWDYRDGMFHKDLGMRIDLVLATTAIADRVRAAWVDRHARKGSGPTDHAPVIVDPDEAPDGDIGPVVPPPSALAPKRGNHQGTGTRGRSNPHRSARRTWPPAEGTGWSEREFPRGNGALRRMLAPTQHTSSPTISGSCVVLGARHADTRVLAPSSLLWLYFCDLR
jgi:hypothetical protein